MFRFVTDIAGISCQSAAHAVSPRGITMVPRRYINLIVETSFDVFAVPQAGIWVQVLHFPQIRRVGYQSLGGDRR